MMIEKVTLTYLQNIYPRPYYFTVTVIIIVLLILLHAANCCVPWCTSNTLLVQVSEKNVFFHLVLVSPYLCLGNIIYRSESVVRSIPGFIFRVPGVYTRMYLKWYSLVVLSVLLYSAAASLLPTVSN